MIPTSTNYLSTHLNPPDLYGPFWTLTTLIFTLFLSSSLAASISAYLSAPGAEYDYDFQLLSIATSLVYAYGIGLPVLLWLALRYLGVGEWGVVEALAVWGYAQFVWVPVSVSVVFTQDFEGESAENFLMDRFYVSFRSHFYDGPLCLPHSPLQDTSLS